MDQKDINMSLIEDDVFKDVTDEDLNEILYWNTPVLYLVTDVILIIVILLAAAADVFLITILLKFKRLKTRINSYILHFSILNLLFHIFSPTVTFVIFRFASIHKTLDCLSFEIKTVCMSGSFLMATALALDWYLMAFKPEYIRKIGKIYTYFFIVLYGVMGITFLTFVPACFQSRFYLYHSVIRYDYLFCLVTLTTLNVLIYYRNIAYEATKTAYAITVANIAVYAWLPMFIIHTVLIGLVLDFPIIMDILDFGGIVVDAFAYGSPILIVYILGKRNKYFKMAYETMFKKSMRSYEIDAASEEDNHVGNRVENADLLESALTV